MENDFIITGIRRIVLVEKDEYPEKKTSFRTHNKSNELIFHMSGDMTVLFGDVTMETPPNTVRFLPEGDTTRYEVHRREVGDCIDVCFYADRPISSKAFVVDVSKNERIPRLFKKIFICWVAKEEGYYHECISLLYSIFAELEKHSYFPGEQFLKIRPALDAIHDIFLHKTPTITELSTLCGISESYLKQLFYAKYGVSPKKYMIQLKLNHACELLRLEEYSITQIAEMCNFSDVYFFSRQFKAYMGITPTQFVKKYRSSK